MNKTRHTYTQTLNYLNSCHGACICIQIVSIFLTEFIEFCVGGSKGKNVLYLP